MSEELVKLAKEWAHAGHDSIGQRRKYEDKPYWIHTDRVDEILKEHGHGPYLRAAGNMHDLIEDVAPTNPNYSLTEMKKLFPEEVVNLVVEVTDVFVKSAYPEWNRKKRHQHERQRIANISVAGKTLKLADILANIENISKMDTGGFGLTFLREKFEVLPLLTSGDKELHKRVVLVLNEQYSLLNS
jgi:(p)ppGpp synthase/HD superfamily hydrolase